jgi:hypothetical protein
LNPSTDVIGYRYWILESGMMFMLLITCLISLVILLCKSTVAKLII